VANRFSNVLANVRTKLLDLVDSGTLRAVRNTLLTPTGDAMAPVATVVASRMRRDGSTWIGEALLQVLVGSGGSASEETIVETMAAIDAALAALMDSGSAGGVIDRPVWDFWPHRTAGGEWVMVGCMATLRVRVEDPLLIL